MSSSKKTLLALLIVATMALGVFISTQETLPAIQSTYADSKTLPDFSTLTNTQQKKTSFFAYLTPIFELENKHVLAIRQQLKLLGGKELNQLTPTQKRWLLQLATHYRIKHHDQFNPELYQQLLKRVDVIPVSLGLTQAALESAWGTSRFAREGNNLFGQWCFEIGCGLVPMARSAGKSHEVAKFDSINQSVRSYIHNLNTHPSYQHMRRVRLDSREQNIHVSGKLLAKTLGRYSEEGDRYIKKLIRFLAINKLEQVSVEK